MATIYLCDLSVPSHYPSVTSVLLEVKHAGKAGIDLLGEQKGTAS